MAGILAYGAYVPLHRLQRGTVAKAHAWFAPGLRSLARGERAIANWDEDAVTMAVEAARDCLGERCRQSIGAAILASTSAPFADRQNATIVKEALALRDSVTTLDLAGGRRSGAAALVQAHHSAIAQGEPVLCMASERRVAQPGSEAELVQGDAAVALLIGDGGTIADLVGSHACSIDFVDHFRQVGAEHDYAWETRWIRDEGYLKIIPEALREAFGKFGIEASQVDRLIIPVTQRGVAAGVARNAGVRPEAVSDTLGEGLGDTGAAHPLMMLAAALEDAGPGELIVVASFGQGCDILAFRTTDRIGQSRPLNGVSGSLARRMPDDNYLRYLSFTGALRLERGMRAEFDNKVAMSTLYRNRKAILGLIGGRCTKTGVVQYPRSDFSVGSDESSFGLQEDYPLADRQAKVISFTADNLTFTPAPPLYYGMVEFEGGGRLSADFADVADKQSVQVGSPMRMVFRIKAFDELRNFTNYFWKAVPLGAAASEVAGE